MIHRLKTWPAYFNLVADGRKKFEIRRNDRDFHPGDELLLQEWDPVSSSLTGRELAVSVTSMMAGGQFGLHRDYCVMSIEPLTAQEAVA